VRRAILALVGTATGTVLLVGAKAGHATGAPAQVPLAGHSSASPGAAQPTLSAGVPNQTPPTGAATTAPATGSGGTAAGGGAASTTTAPASPQAPARPHTDYLQDGSWPGSAVYTEYGFVELKITVANKKITDVITVDYPQDRAESRETSGNAVKKLRTEALSAQSANINSVSGATETSAAYKRSLQAAINTAHGG
jgi:uncharacterized protein with FMN-binding domain